MKAAGSRRTLTAKQWQSTLKHFNLVAIFTFIIVLREVNILPITVDGENYYTAKEAAEYLDISRDTFYRNVKDRLPPYHYGALRREYFRQSDLDKYRGIRPAEEDR